MFQQTAVVTKTPFNIAFSCIFIKFSKVSPLLNVLPRQFDCRAQNVNSYTTPNACFAIIYHIYAFENGNYSALELINIR